jgi:hypothetical protein
MEGGCEVESLGASQINNINEVNERGVLVARIPIIKISIHLTERNESSLNLVKREKRGKDR